MKNVTGEFLWFLTELFFQKQAVIKLRRGTLWGTPCH